MAIQELKVMDQTPSGEVTTFLSDPTVCITSIRSIDTDCRSHGSSSLLCFSLIRLSSPLEHRSSMLCPLLRFSGFVRRIRCAIGQFPCAGYRIYSAPFNLNPRSFLTLVHSLFTSSHQSTKNTQASTWLQTPSTTRDHGYRGMTPAQPRTFRTKCRLHKSSRCVCEIAYTVQFPPTVSFKFVYVHLQQQTVSQASQDSRSPCTEGPCSQ